MDLNRLQADAAGIAGKYAAEIVAIYSREVAAAILRGNLLAHDTIVDAAKRGGQGA